MKTMRPILVLVACGLLVACSREVGTGMFL